MFSNRNFETMELDEDLRILTAMKTQNPGYQLTESVRRKIRKDLSTTNAIELRERSHLPFIQSSESEVNIANDSFGLVSVAELQEQVRMLTRLHQKKELGTTGFIAGVLKWDINFFTGKFLKF